MAAKSLSPRQHGIADWGFVAGLLAIPKLIGVNADARRFYNGLACNVVAINGVTDHGVGVVPLIPVKVHEKLDYANLALLYGMFAANAYAGTEKRSGFIWR
jgi:hypothetical protein